jgi:hypothetical protein
MSSIGRIAEVQGPYSGKGTRKPATLQFEVAYFDNSSETGRRTVARLPLPVSQKL